MNEQLEQVDYETNIYGRAEETIEKALAVLVNLPSIVKHGVFYSIIICPDELKLQGELKHNKRLPTLKHINLSWEKEEDVVDDQEKYLTGKLKLYGGYHITIVLTN